MSEEINMNENMGEELTMGENIDCSDTFNTSRVLI